MDSPNSSATKTTEAAKNEDENPKTTLKMKDLSPSRANPSTGVTLFAMFTNHFWTLGFAYGLTGSWRIASVPAVLSLILTGLGWVGESMKDHERWEITRKYRERGFPTAFLPKTIFDWDEYSRTLNATAAPPTG